MSWSRVIGQERVKGILKSAFTSGKLPHAYLFFGPAGSGKDAAAIELARTLNCQRKTWEACGSCDSCRRLNTLRHPHLKLIFALPSKDKEETAIAKLSDAEFTEVNEQIDLKAADPYHVLNVPKATVIKVSSIRDVRREASFRAMGEGRTVVLISEADRMNASAANALLKTLEEPGGDVLLILTTARRDALLTTIVSRCQQVRFDPLSEEEIVRGLERDADVDPKTLHAAAQLANGSYTLARTIARDGLSIPREEIRQYVRSIVTYNPMTLLPKLRSYTSHDQQALVIFLSGVQNWFRDVLAVQSGASERLRSVDLRESIESFSAHYPEARCAEAIETIEEGIALLPRNVTPLLVMIVLSQKLRKCIVSDDL